MDRFVFVRIHWITHSGACEQSIQHTTRFTVNLSPVLCSILILMTIHIRFVQPFHPFFLMFLIFFFLYLQLRNAIYDIEFSTLEQLSYDLAKLKDCSGTSQCSSTGLASFSNAKLKNSANRGRNMTVSSNFYSESINDLQSSIKWCTLTLCQLSAENVMFFFSQQIAMLW